VIYIDQVYDKFYNIREDDVIIDVGAHVGVFTLKASRKAKEGKVIAIEPHPQNYMLLLKNITINKLENVIPINLALSDSEGVAKLYISRKSLGHTIKEKRIELSREEFSTHISYIEVETKTLDQVVNELGLSKVDFIKIDVEGAELDVLKGATKTLEENNVFLAIAAYHTPESVQEVSRYLQGKGFRTFEYSHYVYAFKPSCYHEHHI